MTLTEFLLARIAEDEATLRRYAKWVDSPASHFDSVTDCDCGEDHVYGSYLVVDPARMLAECEAKRRIVEIYAGGLALDDYGHMFDAMRALASVYADHPDHRAEWKP